MSRMPPTRLEFKIGDVRGGCICSNTIKGTVQTESAWKTRSANGKYACGKEDGCGAARKPKGMGRHLPAT